MAYFNFKEAQNHFTASKCGTEKKQKKKGDVFGTRRYSGDVITAGYTVLALNDNYKQKSVHFGLLID